MAVSPFFRSQKDRAPAGAAMSGPEAEHRVVQVIVEAIMDHRVAPGARLIERELAIASGASRSAIRNGLMRLAHAGLVELSPNKGASIAMCSPDEARQIFDARIVIETAAVKKLAGTIGEASWNACAPSWRTSEKPMKGDGWKMPGTCPGGFTCSWRKWPATTC